MSLIALLEAGRRDFLEATRIISPEQAFGKPSPRSWSVLDCIEHVVYVEGRFLGWISNGTAVAPQRDPDKEIRFGSMNGAELIHLIDGHARRHADQIRETCEALAQR